MMKNNKQYNILLKIVLTSVLCIIAAGTIISQEYKVELYVSKQPGSEIITGSVRGDKFTAADTIEHETDTIRFEIPRDAHTGLYRVILGQTVYAQVMHEPPQKVDFIFNKEDILLRTDFEHPFDSLYVVSSVENKVWHKFIVQDKKYNRELNDLVRQINYFQKAKDDKYYTDKKKKEIISRYNEIQKKHEALIKSVSKKYPRLYAAKMIKMHRTPFLDGNLSKEKRDSIYNAGFFKVLDFSDPELINSDVYTDRIFEYIMKNVPADEQREKQVEKLINAVDRIIDNTSSNEEVNDFIVDYLLRGFEKLGFTDVLDHIADRYTPKVPCTSDNKTTFRRRLDFLKMRKDTVVPDFKLADINGDSISLNDVNSKYKLIVFWASWCPHCEQLLPDIYQWYLNRSHDVEVIAISVDTDKNAWKEFVNSRGYDWINCNEPEGWDGKVATEYNVYATPTMFLVDNENRIIAKPLSFNDLLDSIIGLK
jgi:thiol-disulfide isomerase/thioredoxin